MKVKEDTEIEFRGKKLVLRKGVDYKNLPKEIKDQLPKSRKKKEIA